MQILGIPLYLVSAFYNGNKKKIALKFYDPASHKIIVLDDNTGHKPYCLTNLPIHELEKNYKLINMEGFDHLESIHKTNPLTNEIIPMSKIVAKDPLSIGNANQLDIRTIIPEVNPEGKIWESNIKYYQSYLYDRDLIVGLPYTIDEIGIISPYSDKKTLEKINEILTLFGDVSPEEKKILKRWIQFLEIPAPSMLKLALDIEVQSSDPTKMIPDANRAEFPIIAVGLQTSDNKKIILLLRREGIEDGDLTKLSNYEYIFFDREEDLILELFKYLNIYPFVFTFNGDNFDMLYIHNRAKNLKLESIPIIVQKEKTTLLYGLHIDLYRFFDNKSVKNYAFKQKYDNVGLDDVAGGLINKHKIDINHDFSSLSYSDLSEYCMRDTELTFELTDFDNEVVLKLMVVFMRIANLPFEDVTRLRVSSWIRSFMYHEHRRRDILIPWVEDIKAKGEIQTKATIKGKKYRGAIVVESPSGVFFTVIVIDFASLYPSIIKEYNLDYMTINGCNHEECKTNIVPETTHYVCKKLKGMAPLLIGTLKDVRVKYYKKQTKRKDLTPAEKTWYNCVSEGVKVIMNASYGVFGSEDYDLYCPPVAEAITSIARWVISSTITKAVEFGMKVIYGDTDSIFLHNPTEEQIAKLITWTTEALKLDLEVDKTYKYVIFSSRKKNYIGCFQDGKLDLKGITGKKKHIPIIIKRSFDKSKVELSKVNTMEDFKNAKRQIIEIIKDSYFIFKQRKWESLTDLAFHIVLGKGAEEYSKSTPQHVKAANIITEKTGREMNSGEIIHYVKTVEKVPLKKGGYKEVDSVLPLEFAKNSDINVHKYMEQLESTFAPICEPLEILWEKDIKGLQSLESFGIGV